MRVRNQRLDGHNPRRHYPARLVHLDVDFDFFGNFDRFDSSLRRRILHLSPRLFFLPFWSGIVDLRGRD